MSNRNWHISVANYGILIVTISHTQSSLISLFTSFCPIHSMWPVSERKIAPLPILSLSLWRFHALYLSFHFTLPLPLFRSLVFSHSISFSLTHSIHLILYHSLNFSLSLTTSPSHLFSRSRGSRSLSLSLSINFPTVAFVSYAVWCGKPTEWDILIIQRKINSAAFYLH